MNSAEPRTLTQVAAANLRAHAPEIAAVGVVFAAYWFVLTLTNIGGPWRPLLHGLANTVTLVAMATIARALLRNHVFGRLPQWQFAAHLVLGILFALVWYWLLMIALGLLSGRSLTHFEVRDFFPTRALAWQLLQGFSFYGLVAALSYLQDARQAVWRLPPTKTPSRSRFFVRVGEEIHPLEAAQIITIASADDYSEVTTSSGRHLVRMTLSEFEAALDGEIFIRVHRSRIVNVERLVKAEPAGSGRLLLHMEDGDAVTTSRAGARALRDRVI